MGVEKLIFCSESVSGNGNRDNDKTNEVACPPLEV